MQAPTLTSLSHGAGCGCKLPAAELLPIVGSLPPITDARVLIGSASGDDAAVFALRDDLALVQTVDFFTPIVDDPFDFGRIAAANALSDIYAMGAEPLTALNLVAFPLERLGGQMLRAILEGGADVAGAAGCAIVGGHSIDDPEPKYGLAVTGTVDPRRMLTTAGARAGDSLVLTKPLGVGAIATAARHGRAEPGQVAIATTWMTTLNAAAGQAAQRAGASAATDVTGFGLLGHLHNLCRASGLSALVAGGALPSLPGASDLLAGGHGISGGLRRNRQHAESFTRIDAAVPEAARWLACDPQTSGGLLVAVAPERAATIDGTLIGELIAGVPGHISLQ